MTQYLLPLTILWKGFYDLGFFTPQHCSSISFSADSLIPGGQE